MREEQRESRIRCALDVHTGDVIAARCSSKGSFEVLFLALRVLPFGPVEQGERELVLGTVGGDQLVGGLRWKEGEFGGNAAGTRWTAEEAAQLAETEAICTRVEWGWEG